MTISTYFGLSFTFLVKTHNSVYHVLYFSHSEEVSVNDKKKIRTIPPFPPSFLPQSKALVSTMPQYHSCPEVAYCFPWTRRRIVQTSRLLEYEGDAYFTSSMPTVQIAFFFPRGFE